MGFVKYFWRDAISRLNEEQKSALTVQLCSLDVAGLNIPPVSGKNLVKHAGSLVGRDFRVIVQVAPFVLHDLLPPFCMKAWIALCVLVPLVWQPAIYNRTQFMVSCHFISLVDSLMHITARKI